MRPLLVLLVCLAVACGGSSSSGPTPPLSTPTPAPPVTTPAPRGCNVTALGPGDGLSCPREQPSFLVEVDAAIEAVVRRHPEYFDLNNTSGRGEYLVLRPAPFVVEVIRELEAVGLCAGTDTQELQVKRTNDFNDQYHIILSTGHIRRGFPSYRSTCSPAAFPTPGPQIGIPLGCALPSSRAILCSRVGERPMLQAEVDRAIDALKTERPQLFQGERVLDATAYHEGVARLLTANGRCSRFDGEEIAVKASNDFSEQYDILLSSGVIRRGDGAFRANCYPAVF
jgi:hypothetical protein